MVDEKKVQKLIKKSKEVINDCVLDNGAVVAANSTKDYYPKDVENYFFVWPRDASFLCLANEILGQDEISENFFSWLMKRAGGWKETGLFYENYHPNGSKYRLKFQPDQTGIVLFALASYLKNNPEKKKKFARLGKNTADALCKKWDKDHFNSICNDLWEERLCYSDEKQIFNYSLGACIAGLEKIAKIFPNKKYLKTAKQMKEVFKKEARKDDYVIRSFGEIRDRRIDASAMGLIWPFRIVSPKSKMAEHTIKEIKSTIGKKYKIHRYENDTYDCRKFNGTYRKTGSGYWPLLNFWMSIVLSKAGKRSEALKYYNQVLDDVDGLIPEQIFDNDIQKSVTPLCWSHVMFILASKELRLIK